MTDRSKEPQANSETEVETMVSLFPVKFALLGFVLGLIGQFIWRLGSHGHDSAEGAHHAAEEIYRYIADGLFALVVIGLLVGVMKVIKQGRFELLTLCLIYILTWTLSGLIV